MSKEYRKETENVYLDKVESMCSGMPKVVTRFERSIQQTTEVRTRYAYLCDIKKFLGFVADEISVPIMDITPVLLGQISKDTFEDYISYLQKYEKDGKVYTNGRAAIKRKIAAVRKFYSYMLKSDLIDSCNIEKIDLPKLTKKEIVYMDSEEAEKFLDTVSEGRLTGTAMEKKYHDLLGYRDFVITSLLLSTGIRVSELVGLDIHDIDLKNSCLRVIRKGNKEDCVYYSDDTMRMLSEYLEYRQSMDIVSKDNNALFLSTRNTRLSVRSVENIVKKYARKAVPLKDIHCHSTRSTFAMEFLKNSGGDIEGLQSALGHANITTSQFYARSTQDMKKARKDVVNFLRKE